jgi:hypothetical protein
MAGTEPPRPDAEAASLVPRRWFAERAASLQLTRFVLLRGIGFIYLVAFTILVRQVLPLIGEHGLMPAARFLERVGQAQPSTSSFAAWSAFSNLPSLFWLGCSDRALIALAWLGWLISLALTLGLANAPLLFCNWVLYESFVHVGQTFYGYGWDILLLEAGFLAVFLAPAWRPWPRARAVPPLPVIWLFRWLLFRLMFGAGLIKLRGDECWRDLTCLLYHYETQPNPHPLSWLLHQAPPWFQKGGVLVNHLVEVVTPFGLFGPRRVRHWAGGATVAFQVMLILSGNLSFLNWLTLVLALACFDDALLARLLPRALVQRIALPDPQPLPRPRQYLSLALLGLVALLSINPVANLLSSSQRMNSGFDPLELVNTYGAFGSVSRERHEVVLEGAAAPGPGAPLTWLEYEFPCKPGDPLKAPCWITPYHYRLDWQMWFAGLSRAEHEPWIVNLADKLLQGDSAVLGLLSHNPFPDAPPRYLRATLYRYQFTHFGERGWWQRERVGPYLPVLQLDDPRLQAFLRGYGWL